MNASGDQATSPKVQKLSESENRLGDTQETLEDIDSCQTAIDILNEKASEEILQVEQKYNKLRKPHFEKRNELIKNIPNFWVTAFINHPRLSSVVHVEEEECLHHLSRLEVEEFEDIKSGYVFRFHFSPNPFFTNDVLTKEFHLGRGSPVATSSEIHWKDNMNLILRAGKLMFSRKRRRGGGRSFFSWFKAPIEPSVDSIAEVLKDDLWPNPVQYYLAPDTDVEANGISDDGDSDCDDVSNDDGPDDSIVVVGDDDDDEEENDNLYSDEDEVYDVDDDEDDLLHHQWTTIDEIGIGVDIDDAIEVLDSDGEAEAMNTTPEDAHVIDSSHELIDSSQDAVNTTAETASTSQDTADNSQEIADTSQETTDISNETADAACVLANISQDIANTSQNTVDTSPDLAETSQEEADTTQEADMTQESTEATNESADTSQESNNVVKSTEEILEADGGEEDPVMEVSHGNTEEEQVDGGEKDPVMEVAHGDTEEQVDKDGGEEDPVMEVAHGDTEEQLDKEVEDKLLKDNSDNESEDSAGQ